MWTVIEQNDGFKILLQLKNYGFDKTYMVTREFYLKKSEGWNSRLIEDLKRKIN